MPRYNVLLLSYRVREKVKQDLPRLKASVVTVGMVPTPVFHITIYVDIKLAWLLTIDVFSTLLYIDFVSSE